MAKVEISYNPSDSEDLDEEHDSRDDFKYIFVWNIYFIDVVNPLNVIADISFLILLLSPIHMSLPDFEPPGNSYLVYILELFSVDSRRWMIFLGYKYIASLCHISNNANSR